MPGPGPAPHSALTAPFPKPGATSMTAVRPADSLPPCWRSVNAEWADSAHTASHHSPSPASQSWPPGPVSVRDLHGGPAGRMGELPHQCEETHVAPTPNPLPSCPECTRRAQGHSSRGGAVRWCASSLQLVRPETVWAPPVSLTARCTAV